jgi:GGDEF domain-containing protein
MKAIEVIERVAELAAQFEELAKAAPEVREAMKGLQAAAKTGALDPKHVDAIRRGLFTDRMTGGKMGNQAAYEDFALGAKGGVHVRLDANDFGSINKMHGFETGNEAIKSLGHGIRTALDETVGQSKSKLFRIGGDEFHVHVPTHEHAAVFARKLRQKLGEQVPVGGTHRLSVSMGFGHSPEHAEQALIHAKTAKKAMNYPVGQAQTHAHSLVSGKEGAVPLSEHASLKMPLR